MLEFLAALPLSPMLKLLLLLLPSAGGVVIGCWYGSHSQLWLQAFQHLRPREQPLHSGGGDEHPPQRADRNPLWRRHWRLGQPALCNPWWQFYSPHSQKGL